MSSVGLAERNLRDSLDEFFVEVETSNRTAPPTPDERWQDALDIVHGAQAEALAARVSLEPIEHQVLGEVADAISLVEETSEDAPETSWCTAALSSRRR